MTFCSVKIAARPAASQALWEDRLAELLVIRHGQASFGAENYDKLSDIGREQSRRAGDWLRAHGWVPDRVLTGDLSRQRGTADEMGFASARIDPGFDEYDSGALLAWRPFTGSDRRAYFLHLRETVHAWIDGGECGGETFANFAARVDRAFCDAMRPGAKRVLVVSSGGVVGRMVAETLKAPPRMMMALNLQVRNTAMTRWIYSPRGVHLHSFNALPHLSAPADAALETLA